VSKERLLQLSKDIQEKKNEYRGLAKVLLEAELRKIFDDHPAVNSFSWKQYTTYFNDGDTCYFNVYSDEWGIEINDRDYDAPPEENNPLSTKEYMQVSKKISTVVNAIEEEALKDIYGDHVQVYVTRHAVEQHDYTEHD
jgi:hypothetical protein